MSTILEASHQGSGLALTVEDEGDSWWAYLVDTEVKSIVADAWVRNKIPSPSRDELGRYRGGPPPAVVGFDGGTPFHDPIDPETFEVTWSPSGKAVQALLGHLGEVVLSSGRRRGFSRMLARSGPWGEQWRDAGVAEAMEKS